MSVEHDESGINNQKTIDSTEWLRRLAYLVMALTVINVIYTVLALFVWGVAFSVVSNLLFFAFFASLVVLLLGTLIARYGPVSFRSNVPPEVGRVLLFVLFLFIIVFVLLALVGPDVPFPDQPPDGTPAP